MADCNYRFRDTAGARQTITGKPAMMAALVSGRMDHLLSADAVAAMAAPSAAAPKSAQTPRTPPAPAPNTIFTEDAATKARELLRRKLGQLNSGLDPEMLQAGITLAGYHIEKGARSFSAYAQAMLADLGDAVRPYLKSWYMGVKYDPRAAGFEGMDTATTVEAADENQISKEPENAPSADSRVERDSEVAAPERAVGDAVQDEGRGAGTGNRDAGGQASRGGRSGQSDGAGVPADRAVAGGERSDQQLPAGNPTVVLADIATGDQFGERGSDIGFDGVSADPIPASQVERSASAGAPVLPLLAQQRAAEKLKVVSGDLENIRATLPYLLPGQQDDVKKAEDRFAKPDGYGMLFTNGAGTGKTFSGLGVVKRFARQGKTNILVVVPDDKISADWIESGEPLGLSISKLKDTKDAGKGVVVTTYANLGENDQLANREWDLVVADEAHSLMQSADGRVTTYLANLRAITLHPDGAYQRHTMLYRDDIEALRELTAKIAGNTKILNNPDTMDAMMSAVRDENERLGRQARALSEKIRKTTEEVQVYVAERQGAARPRLVALSATPFAYEKTVDWANGYLFDYNEGRGDESRSTRGYNEGSNREQLFMQHFGYSMRYNKLTEPDGSKVDRGLLQRQFNGWLKKNGSLSSRMLDVAADYDRRFVLVDSAIGNQIDEALSWLSESARNAPKDDRGFAAVRDAISENFDYLSRRYLLEAIKATEAVPIVKEHLRIGRKVVVFHDYKKGGGFNPFKIDAATENPGMEPDVLAMQQQFNAALRQFNAKFAGLVNAPLGGLPSPIEVFKREFPEVLLINGDEKKADLLKRYKHFQDDASGPAVMLVQSAKNKGWSGHDTTGKHQRVLINLGQPTAPTLAIQQEGRIYRTGQVSNAIMRYLNTGTNWEKWAFATTIASRASTAENLGMGELSRALKDSFISAFEESDAYPPGHEGEGTGGKERDQSQNNALTAYDRAKTFYWATQKKNSKTKAQEGTDYFATPEPLGFKMVEWLGLRGGEDALEPSGGHGAIARWLPDSVQRTVIEPSPALRSRLAMVMDLGKDRIIDGTFEELANVNKFDGIVMNPPFGVGGKTAVEHLAKAAAHLRDGGRIVALIPTGPAADKRFEKWMNGEEMRDAKPVARDFSTAYPEIYQGDTVTYTDVLGNTKTGKVTSRTGERLYVRSDGDKMSSSVTQFQIKAITPTGPRTETYRPSDGLHQVAEIRLPQVTFERAGTAVATRIVVIDKHGDPTRAPNPRSPIDLTGIADIRELFDRLEDMSLPARAMTADQKASSEQAEAQPAAGQVAPQGPTIAANGRKVVKHVTQKGKTIHGIVAKDITKEQAQEIDPYTFKKDGGWFIREKHVKSGDAAPKFSRASTTPLPDTNIRRSAASPVPASGITAESLPGIFAQRFPKLAGAIKTMLDRGALGQKGGLVVLDTNDETQIAREFADRTGRTFDETVQMFESGAGEINGFYDALSGTTFLVGPNLDGDTASAVMLHEMTHGQQRQSLDEKALAMINDRAKAPRALGQFLTRVAQRMEDVDESGNASEATAYIVEMAVQEGRQAGFSAADGPILAWIEKNIGKPVADLVREFVAMARAWALAHGVDLKRITVDDLVAYAKLGLKRAADGRVVTFGRESGNIAAMSEREGVAGRQAPTPSNSPDVKFSRTAQAALGPLSAAQQSTVERIFGKPKTLRERAEAFAKDWQKNLVQGIFDQFAPIKELTSKGYMLARLAKGSDSTLEAMLMYGKVSVDADGVYKVDFDGKNLNGFAKTMAKLDGEHDRFLAWVSGLRAERLSGVGLENLMTPADIAALQSLADGNTKSGKVRRALYADALKDLNAFNDSVLKIASDSGLIDEATREMYRDVPYVPFYRLSEEDVVQGPSVSKGLVNQAAWKQLKGGTNQLNEDLMGNLLKNWSHLITASANNRAAKEVLDTAARMGAATDMTNDVVAQDINGQPIYRGNTKGLVRYRGEIKRKIPKGQPYIENGQTLISDGTAEISYVGDRYFKVDDPHLMDAISSIGFTTKVWKPMADFKRYLTFGVTVNPTFKIRNLIRDSIQAVGTAELSYNPVQNILMGAKGTAMMSNVRAQMMASGGMLRFGSAEGGYSGHVRRLIEKGIDPQYILDDDNKLKAFWKHKVLPAFEAYQELGDRSENVNRAALYEQLLTKGMSHAEASFWARDMMDFSMHGKWAAIRTLTAVVPFMNARLQGIYKLGRATKADYRRMGATLAAVSVASMALMLAYGDDDEWKKREDWDRDGSWWFKVGGVAFRIPKPFEVGAIGTIAERSLELMISDEMTGKRFGERMRDLLMHNLSMNPTPQIIKPMIDLYANKDGFSGREIETQGMEKLRPEDRYTNRTSEVARFLGQIGLPNPAQLLMGRVEGLSPVQIDHLIRGYFAWVGTSATTALDYGIRPMMDRGDRPDMRLKDVFLVGNFAQSLPSGSSRYVTQFYAQAKEIEQMYASYQQAIKEGDTAKAQEIRADNAEGFAARRRIESAKRAQSLISGQMRTIERSREMSGEEKRARLDQLEKQRDRLARQALLVTAAPGRD